ncbi:MAG: tetratricopeptide repeat protein [Acidobacteria bacterium]|nr:tetratricopeptide repeat protein [Acidobacteriota bacterium]
MKRFAYLVMALVILSAAAMPGLCQKVRNWDDQSKEAMAFEMQGNDSEAEAAWRAELKEHPDNADAYANLGLIEAHQQRYKEAVPMYRKALALNPAIPGLRLNLALSLFKSGALDAAVRIFTALLRSEPPSSPEALRFQTLIGLADFGLGRYSAAIPYLKLAAAGNAQNLPFRLALAQSCLWSKQYQCVLDVYAQILELNSESAEADMLAGEAFDGLGNDAGALQQFRAAVKADPRMPHVHFGLGYLLWRSKEFDEAAQEFNAELAIDPDDAEALTYLADTDIHMEMGKKATPLLERALRIDPQLELAHLDVGVVDSEEGRQSEALREFKVAARLNPGDVQVHWRLARLYKAAGMKGEAQAEFDKTRTMDKEAKDHAALVNQMHEATVKGLSPEGSLSVSVPN